MNFNEMKEVVDSGTITMDPATERGIVGVNWEIGGIHFRGQFDPDNRGIYAVGFVEDYEALDGLKAIKKGIETAHALELLEKWTELYVDGATDDDAQNLYIDTLAVLG